MTQRDTELIAQLPGHPSYHALLRLLEEDEKILLSKLEKAMGEEAVELLALWKAHRRIAKTLADTPLSLYRENPDFSEVS